MIKIFLSVRNRLEVTKKCIEALKRHSTIPHQIYVYDNDSNYLVDKHFAYFYEQYIEREITQITFTTEDSTFNAFSKASTNNFFGLQHENDPNKDKYDFLVILDNDVIVTPEWDKKLKITWDYVNEKKLDYIKIIGQHPGGMDLKILERYRIDENMKGVVGTKGGSGLWSVRTNFYGEVGYLNLKRLSGLVKEHDTDYWNILEAMSSGKPYIMGLNKKLGIHCGILNYISSVCTILYQNREDPERAQKIKFEEDEDKLSKLSFSQFFAEISKNKKICASY